MKIQKNIFTEKWALLVILAVVVLAHVTLFQNQFILEDGFVLHHWKLIQKLTNLPRFFVNYIPPDSQPGIYAPLRTLFLAVSRRVFADLSLGYHVTALMIHLLGVFTVYRLAILLTDKKSIAVITALLFGLHPVHVAALSGIIAGIETLGFVFMLLSFYFYVRAKELSGEVFSGDRGKSLLFFALSVLTVEWALILPVVIIFYDTLFRVPKRSFKQVLPSWLMFVVITGLYYASKWLVLGQWAPGTYVFDRFDLSLFIGLKALIKYLWLLIFPLSLAYNHVLSPGISSFNIKDFDKQTVLSQSILEPQVILSLLVVLSLCVAAWRQYRRRPVITFALGWVMILLLPALQIVPSGMFFNERFLYGAAFGFCLLAGFVVDGVWSCDKRILKTITPLALLAAVLFYGGRTFYRHKDYAGPVVFFEKAVRANPQSAYLAGDLGVVYTRAGAFEKALQSYEKAIALKPEDQHFHFSKELTCSMMKRYDDSIASLKKAIELQPDFPEAYYNLAGLYRFLQRGEEANGNLIMALKLYVNQGRLLEANAALLQMEQYRNVQEQVLKHVLDEIPGLKKVIPKSFE